MVTTVLCLLTAGAVAESPGIRDDVYASLVEITRGIEERWTRFELDGVVVLASQPELVYPAALERTSEFMEELLERFDEDGRIRAELSADPIRYIFAPGPMDVQLFTGIDTDGMALVEHGIVVSRRFPHEHELAHMVAHRALAPRETSGTAPLIREGLASYLGGSRGRTPAVTLALGDSYLDLRLCVPSLLLSSDEFYAGWLDPGVAYAVAARWVQFLIESRGWERFARLYWLLTATPSQIDAMPASSVLLQIQGVYETSWSELSADFERWRRANPSPGVEAAPPPLAAPTMEMDHDGRRLRMWQRELEWIVELRAETGYPEMRLQWGEALPQAPGQKRAALVDGEARRRFDLALRPAGIELTDQLLGRVLQVSSPFALTLDGEDSASPRRQVCVRIPWQADEAPAWPSDPILWVSPRLR